MNRALGFHSLAGNRVVLVVWPIAVLCVSALALQPAGGPPEAFGIDKGAHAVAFLAVASLPAIGFRRLRVGIAAALAMIPHGIFIDVTQSFVPGRTASAADAMADVMGVILGLAVGLAARWLAIPHACVPRWVTPLFAR
ncbi:hypothetical protein FBZ84_13527 [Azospirillum baldaniorum]|uniref:VanZ family protein n=1 Tax=Azospirillum baldaniorum TaxID=1064539 RepID=UPI0011AAAA45|nr:VanZ family protein [Azospirillum baldaniorum]TWA52907.1 hypothetical protein FBZ84_13527 [Azospirillum baldaniorum]